MNENTKTILEEIKEVHKYSGELISKLEVELQQYINPHLKTVRKEGKKLLLIAAADNSGSVGKFEKRTFKSVHDQLSKAFADTYDSVEFKYIHFTTEAKEVLSEDFLTNGDNGGTIVSSGMRMAFNKMNDLLISAEADKTDIAVILFSDGDNLTSDCPRVERIVDAIKEKANFIYVETNQYKRYSPLGNTFKHMKSKPKFAVIHEKDNIDLVVSKAYESLVNNSGDEE